eukprot:scaffold36984_cov28-Prasinocladus_malaysianus.AAC.1
MEPHPARRKAGQQGAPPGLTVEHDSQPGLLSLPREVLQAVLAELGAHDLASVGEACRALSVA